MGKLRQRNPVLEQFCEALEWNPFARSDLPVWGKGDFFMASSYDLRRYSGNCLVFAENVSNPDDKARLIEMAQEFLELAIKQEQKDFAVTEMTPMKAIRVTNVS